MRCGQGDGNGQSVAKTPVRRDGIHIDMNPALTLLYLNAQIASLVETGDVPGGMGPEFRVSRPGEPFRGPARAGVTHPDDEEDQIKTIRGPARAGVTGEGGDLAKSVAPQGEQREVTGIGGQGHLGPGLQLRDIKTQQRRSLLPINPAGDGMSGARHRQNRILPETRLGGPDRFESEDPGNVVRRIGVLNICALRGLQRSRCSRFLWQYRADATMSAPRKPAWHCFWTRVNGFTRPEIRATIFAGLLGSCFAASHDRLAAEISKPVTK